MEKCVTTSAIKNLSNRELSKIEECVLRKGLKYGIMRKILDTYEILTRFEQLAQSLNGLEIFQSKDELVRSLDAKSLLFKDLQSFAFEFIELSKKAYDNLSEEEKRALEDLGKDKSIIISKADKGNAVVIQNVNDYKEKIANILWTDGKFKKLDDDLTRLREQRLQNNLRRLHKANKISAEVYKDILPCGSRAGVMYGLPKIHKDGAPLRPIISAIKTYNYKLAKKLDELLKPNVEGSEYMIRDSFEFVNQAGQLEPNYDKFMVSFDVESLFTSIPTV
jgi:hypothetical protein